MDHIDMILTKLDQGMDTKSSNIKMCLSTMMVMCKKVNTKAI